MAALRERVQHLEKVLRVAHGMDSRQAALKSGSSKYLASKPCLRGHLGMRYTRTRNCVECQHERNRRSYLRHGPENWGGCRKKEATRPRPTHCELCGKKPLGTPGNSLCHDHDHATGMFRGWLCSKCNMALGMLGDDLEQILSRLLDYMVIQ